MDLGLKGKVAIVTGGSRGIGLAVATTLVREGARVAICGRNETRLYEAAQSLSGCGEDVLAFPADTSQEAQRASFVERVAADAGRIDILVNNAGTHMRGTIDDMTDADLQSQLDDKLFGYLGMIRAVLPHMRRQRDGRIVNIIGQAGRHPHPDRLPSGIANAALQAMTKSIADAVARDNIRINAVCPQYIETELVAGTVVREMERRGIDRATAVAGFTRANVVGRLGRTGEVGDLVAFLVSKRAEFVCGTSVSVDGGYHRYVFG
jgi:NAD(P)-dependent dehydrogenase (short-subunit alcohol dehydrogenase family)